tara:strand:- start:119 stop:295 length:177 start_codon:yes stop_codon:yes gene_type:complete
MATELVAATDLVAATVLLVTATVLLVTATVKRGSPLVKGREVAGEGCIGCTREVQRCV